MDTLTCMRTFVRVVELQSFSKAAREEACSPSLASKKISWLERHLGAKLLNRTTRRLSLTETGEAYYTQSLKVLNEAEVSENIVAEMHGQPQGCLRISCPSGLGVTVFNQAFADFALTYPAITLETQVTDQIVDFTEGRIDFALRVAPSLPDSSLIASEIASVQLNICAAPSYLKEHGMPKIPEDLQNHNCLRYVHTRTGSDVWFLKSGDTTFPTPVTGNYRANNPLFIKAAVVKGLGIAVLPCYIHKTETAEGLIKVILKDYKIDDLKLYLIRQHRDYMPLKMKLFSTFIKDWAHQHMENEG